MIVSAVEAGLTLAEFWNSTPRQTDYAVRAYHRRRGWQAWHVAALIRAETLPDLELLTGAPAPERSEADLAEEQLSNTRGWISLAKTLPVIQAAPSEDAAA